MNIDKVKKLFLLAGLHNIWLQKLVLKLWSLSKSEKYFLKLKPVNKNEDD